MSRKGRVVESHDIARTAFLGAFGFGVVAIVWAIAILVRGGTWWGPMHAFLAGTVLLAISGASQMFTITWASTSPPSHLTATTQRWLIIVGVAAVLFGVTSKTSVLVWAGAGATAGGLVVLGLSVAGAVRRSLLRRFDLSARFYLAAFAAGVLGVSLGAVIGTGKAGASLPRIRLVHSHLNLVGLVGLTIIGTIPTLLPTTAYRRAVSGREAITALWFGLGGVLLIGTGLWAPTLVGIGTILVGLSGAIVLVGIVARIWKEGRSKLTFLQITAGMIWLVVWAFSDGIQLIVNGQVRHFSGSTGAVVVSGIGQVLLGSLAYLLPVLKGSPFEENRAVLTRRPWLPLLTANSAGLLLATGWVTGAILAAATWILDFGIRLIRVARAN